MSEYFGVVVSLDDAYDELGAGLGRTITADAGAVRINNAVADASNCLELNRTGAVGGYALNVVSGDAIFANNVTIGGNLNVLGTTVTHEAETMLIADNHIYMNDGYVLPIAQTGGLVVNYLPTALTDAVAAGGFTAGVPAVSNPTVATVGAAIFAVGDFIQISGSNHQENDGLFEVLSHAANVLTIRGIGVTPRVEDFTQNQFTTDPTVAGTITKVNISVIRAGTDGLWEVGLGSNTPVVFNDLATVGLVTLDFAYDGGGAGLGRTINVDSGAVELRASATQNPVFFIDQVTNPQTAGFKDIAKINIEHNPANAPGIGFVGFDMDLDLDWSAVTIARAGSVIGYNFYPSSVVGGSGADNPVYGFYANARSPSTGNLPMVGHYTQQYGTIVADSYNTGFYSFIAAITLNNANAKLYSFHADWTGAGAKVWTNLADAYGIYIQMPTTYPAFDFVAGKFTGDGRTVEICNTTYAGEFTGDVRVVGNLIVSNSNQLQLMDVGDADYAVLEYQTNDLEIHPSLGGSFDLDIWTWNLSTMRQIWTCYSTNVGDEVSLHFRHSHNDAALTQGQTLNGEGLGRIDFSGCNANFLNPFAMGASIYVEQVGASANFVPAKMVFETYNSGSINANTFVIAEDAHSEFNGNAKSVSICNTTTGITITDPSATNGSTLVMTRSNAATNMIAVDLTITPPGAARAYTGYKTNLSGAIGDSGLSIAYHASCGSGASDARQYYGFYHQMAGTNISNLHHKGFYGNFTAFDTNNAAAIVSGVHIDMQMGLGVGTNFGAVYGFYAQMPDDAIPRNNPIFGLYIVMPTPYSGTGMKGAVITGDTRTVELCNNFYAIQTVGDAYVQGKLTVTGAVDPTSVELSDILGGGTQLYFESQDGQTAPVSGIATGRIRYNDATATWQVSVQAGAYQDILVGTGGVPTLDLAYDGGGAGLGRTITVDSGAVELIVSATQTESLILDRSTTPMTVNGCSLYLPTDVNAAPREINVIDAPVNVVDAGQFELRGSQFEFTHYNGESANITGHFVNILGTPSNDVGDLGFYILGQQTLNDANASMKGVLVDLNYLTLTNYQHTFGVCVYMPDDVNAINNPLYGLNVVMPGAYTGTNMIGAVITGDGRDVSLCTDDYAIDVNGDILASNTFDMDGGAGMWFRPPQMTTAERNAMTGAWGAGDAGKLWFNLTTGQWEGWTGAAVVIIG